MLPLLTKEMIVKKLEQKAKSTSRLSTIGAPIFFVIGIFMIYAGLQASPQWFSVILFVFAAIGLLLAGGLVWAGLEFRKDRQQGKHLKFYITGNTCASKGIEPDFSEYGSQEKYFVLNDYGKMKLQSDHFITDGIADFYEYASDLYDRTKIGDFFYVVVTEETAPHAELIIPASDWKLNPGDFVHKDGKFFPVL